MGNLASLRIGDRLVREKEFGVFTKHHALYAGYHNGNYWVAENQRGYGVRYITWDEFLRPGKLERIENNFLTPSQQNQVIQRVNERVGRGYNVLSYNCETFVNDVLRGVRESKQVQVGIGLGVVGLLLWAALSGEK